MAGGTITSTLLRPRLGTPTSGEMRGERIAAESCR